MNSKLIKASVAGTAAVVLTAGSGTFANWTSTETNTGNEVGAGTLVLQLGPENGSHLGATFDNVRLMPGGEVDQFTLVGSNDGNSVPNGELLVSITNFASTEDGCKGNELQDDANCATTTGAGDFEDDALITMSGYRVKDADPATPGVQADCAKSVPIGGEFNMDDVAGRYRAILSQPIATAAAATDPFTFRWADDTPLVLAPGDGLCIGSFVKLPFTADNASQGDSVSFDVQFDLVQTLSARDANAGTNVAP